MSLVTFEVEIDHGRVVSRGLDPLPDKGHGILTLLPNAEEKMQRGSVSDFVAKWAGGFSRPASLADDPRLDYLLGKHAK
jgi:hypothetical protein